MVLLKNKLIKIAILSIFLVIKLYADPKEVGVIAAQKMAAALDYISSDYSEAVDLKGKKIVSLLEYNEMKNFIKQLYGYAKELKMKSDGPVLVSLKELDKHIMAKSDVSTVQILASNIRNTIINMYAIPTFPNELPNAQKGMKLYRENCAVCHGDDGAANTASARKMNPPPRSFLDGKTLDALSPFKAFNALTFGIEGTGMAAFTSLSDSERWDLASYLFLFRGAAYERRESDPVIHWKTAMSSTDAELLYKLTSSGFSQEKAKAELAQIRELNYVSERPVLSMLESREGIPLKALPRVILDFSIVRLDTLIAEMQINSSKKTIAMARDIFNNGLKRTVKMLKILGYKREAGALVVSWADFFNTLQEKDAHDILQKKVDLDKNLKSSRNILLTHRVARSSGVVGRIFYGFLGIILGLMFCFFALSTFLSYKYVTGLFISSILLSSVAFIILQTLSIYPFVHQAIFLLSSNWVLIIFSLSLLYVKYVYDDYFTAFIQFKIAQVIILFVGSVLVSISSFELLRFRMELMSQILNKDLNLDWIFFGAVTTLFLGFLTLYFMSKKVIKYVHS